MKKIVFIVLVLLIIIQLFRIDKTPPNSNPKDHLFAVENVPNEVQSLLKASCYDCHSNTTSYPWYSNVAPVSWWLKYHVNEGREELNFEEWGSYSDKKKDHKLEEIEEMINENEMPLPSYLWVHNEARLSDQKKNKLIIWAKSLRTGERIEEK